MGPGAELPTVEGSHPRRTAGARRPTAPLRRTAQARWDAARPFDGRADDVALAIVARVQAFGDQQLRSGEAAQPRGMGRQMGLAALLLEREEAADLDECLERVVQVYRDAQATTPAALRKHASEARAILHYGRLDGETLPVLAAAIPGGRDAAIPQIDAMMAALNAREILEARARRLSGQRGGRPTGEAFRVLSAVARLKESAGSGDPKAEAELKLVRTFLLDK